MAKIKKNALRANKRSKTHLEKQAARPDLRLVAFRGKLIMRILRRNEEKMVITEKLIDYRRTPYYEELNSMPTHKIQSEKEVWSSLLSPSEFVVYGYPKPRDYGQMNSHYQRTAEPLKIGLVAQDDYDWQIAVENYYQSELFGQHSLNAEIRQPRLSAGKYRLHYARLLLPEESYHSRRDYWSKEYSPFITCYYIERPDGTGKRVRHYIDHLALDNAFTLEPNGWNRSGRRSHTIPADWLSNRIADLDRYALFA